MPEQIRAPVFIDGLYGTLVEGGINYFFPSATLQTIETGLEPAPCYMTKSSDQTTLVLSWLGSRYSLTRTEAFSAQELELLKGIGAVLDSRYKMIADTDRAEKRFELFRGLPEDRYVSVFIDGDPYAQEIWQGPDRVEDTIEVLRTSSLSTYENRRISTGAMLFGKYPDPAMSRRSHQWAHCAILPRSLQFGVSIVSVMRCRHSRWWIRMDSWQNRGCRGMGPSLHGHSSFGSPAGEIYDARAGDPVRRACLHDPYT